MTVATIIYYTGVHPYTLRPVYTAKSAKQKKNQHLYSFWYKRENHKLIREKLTNMGREDMIDKLVGDRKRANKKEIIKNRKEDTRGPRKGKREGVSFLQ